MRTIRTVRSVFHAFMATGACALSLAFSHPVRAETPFVHPRAQLRKLSPNAKQLWVVGYVNATLADSIHDLEVSFANGADAIVFEGHDYAQLDQTLGELRKRFPTRVLGVNYLGDLVSYEKTFALARKHHLQIAWTDFSGVDLIQEIPEQSLHRIEAARAAGVFYVSGIHMKYSTPVDPEKPIEKSALQAMGWVDGIVITGPQTGVPTDPARARRARSVIGDYPLGVASGVSSENVASLIDQIDFALVNTSISDANHRISGEKVRALRAAMDQAAGGR